VETTRPIFLSPCKPRFLLGHVVRAAVFHRWVAAYGDAHGCRCYGSRTRRRCRVTLAVWRKSPPRALVRPLPGTTRNTSCCRRGRGLGWPRPVRYSLSVVDDYSSFAFDPPPASLVALNRRSPGALSRSRFAESTPRCRTGHVDPERISAGTARLGINQKEKRRSERAADAGGAGRWGPAAGAGLPDGADPHDYSEPAAVRASYWSPEAAGPMWLRAAAVSLPAGGLFRACLRGGGAGALLRPVDACRPLRAAVAAEDASLPRRGAPVFQLRRDSRRSYNFATGRVRSASLFGVAATDAAVIGVKTSAARSVRPATYASSLSSPRRRRPGGSPAGN